MGRNRNTNDPKRILEQDQHWEILEINIENKNREQATNYSEDARANIENLDTDYTNPNIKKVTNEQKYFNLHERAQLLSILRANIQAFQGKRDKCTSSLVYFELCQIFSYPVLIIRSNKERSSEVSRTRSAVSNKVF